MRRSKYTRAVLLPVVRSSTTLKQVIEKLGLRPVAGNYRYIRARMRVAGVDDSHFVHGHVTQQIQELTIEQLEPVVAAAKSYAQVLAAFGLPEEGRPVVALSKHLRGLGLDTAHFSGRAWNRGQTSATNPSLRRAGMKAAFPDDRVFVENSAYTNSAGVVRRLRARGWTYACDECGTTHWCGRDLTLHLEHVNGVHNDNRFENLRFLCPNCHSQTATYGNRTRATRR